MNAIAHPRAEGAASDNATNFGRGWIPQSRDIGLPGEAVLGDRVDGATDYGVPLDATRWTADIKLRFLHLLSGHGNVRVAASAVGLSRQGAYLARRRDGVFARGWDGALVLARRHAEGVLAERALDGVTEDIWFRGELVGTRRRYDTRLLLAHLARLDKAAASSGGRDAEAQFDRLLAGIAGLDAGEAVDELGPDRDAFLDAAILTAEVPEEADDGFVMPDWAVEMRAEEAQAEDARLAAENAAIAAAEAAAGARWDAGWAALYRAVDAALAGEGAESEAAAFALDGVKCVKQPAWPGREPSPGGGLDSGAAAPCETPPPEESLMKPITTAAAALAAATLALGAPAQAQMDHSNMSAAEMRAMPASGITLAATLRGRNEVPRADPDGTGRFSARVNPGRGQVCYTLTSSRLDRLTMAHIHRGAAGRNGPPVVTLRASAPRQTCATVSKNLAKEITRNPSAFYVNVHTVRYPNGAIRGQLSR